MISESASGEQLRRLLKTRQRDALTREHQHRMATGGGPCTDADINPDIAEIAPALLVEIQDTLDSDCNELETVNDQHRENITEINLAYADDTPQPLQDVESTIQPNSSVSRHKASTELSSNEKRAAQLHELQIKCMQEKHNLELEIFKQQLKEAQQNQ